MKEVRREIRSNVASWPLQMNGISFMRQGFVVAPQTLEDLQQGVLVLKRGETEGGGECEGLRGGDIRWEAGNRRSESVGT